MDDDPQTGNGRPGQKDGGIGTENGLWRERRGDRDLSCLSVTWHSEVFVEVLASGLDGNELGGVATLMLRGGLKISMHSRLAASNSIDGAPTLVLARKGVCVCLVGGGDGEFQSKICHNICR